MRSPPSEDISHPAPSLRPESCVKTTPAHPQTIPFDASVVIIYLTCKSEVCWPISMFLIKRRLPRKALLLVIPFKGTITSDTSLNRPAEDTAPETTNGMICVTSEHTWAHQLHRRARGRDAERRAVMFQSVGLMEKDAKRTFRASWTPRAPNHCQMWGGRTENIPESGRKHPAGSTSTSLMGKRHQLGGEDPERSVERRRAENRLGGMRMPPLSSACFFN